MNNFILVIKIKNIKNHHIKYIVIDKNADFFYDTVNAFYNNSNTKKYDNNNEIIDYKLVNLNAIFV